MLWARDGGLPFHRTASEAQALGLALIEHAAGSARRGGSVTI